MAADTTPRTRYHHGQLRQALLDATLALVIEQGMSAWSLRDVARRVGVSPAAPFRHFDSKHALLAAIAEQGMQRFVADIAREVEAAPAEGRLQAMGVGYLRWAIANPAQFMVISDRSLFNLAQSPTLLAQSEAVMGQMDALLQARYGQHPGFALEQARLMFRAQAYGLARMAVDRHLEEWAIPPEQALEHCLRVLDQFFILLPGCGGQTGARSHALPA
ncbi:TetR/AcrR family transcriptional regulator [Leeia aquatica]|uniref:TetR/AcrR family transcriptional regulator n=1 Tax=Leeia aquatica TaxID=2725557 RepID=A0A847SED5_9NEIS|nr:TetR/AcrR family transcriptional regulator [Leeia aquatica]NLR75649.1 TetR/AcrR family transcriptional regulator [Leeia aquatica]